MGLSSAEGKGRVGQSASLGSYVEYPEHWLVALWPLIPWLFAVAYFVVAAALAPGNQSCGGVGSYSGCKSFTAADNREGAAATAVVFSILGSLYLARKVLHRPWVRVGELGIEDRSQMFGIVRVGWHDVLAIPASSPRPITRSVDIRVRAASGLGGPSGWVRIRTGGMAASSDEIEDRMYEAYRRFHGLAPRTRQAPLAPEKRVLPGIEVATAKDTWDDVSQADLHHMIERNGLDDHLLVRSTARGQDHFIQAWHSGSDVWDVEYRDGGPDRHFAASCMTNTEIFDAFMAWIRQDPNLTRLLAWHRLDGLDS